MGNLCKIMEMDKIGGRPIFVSVNLEEVSPCSLVLPPNFNTTGVLEYKKLTPQRALNLLLK